ncbi:hypothetical protein V6259_12945 [Marinomonas sp. TI.3.20]|uniref:hypothetical protein n=1 Tax=Marinomonas sp. TI.3.20 TaxID=3121296 RepID=UPI00311FD3A1
MMIKDIRTNATKINIANRKLGEAIQELVELGKSEPDINDKFSEYMIIAKSRVQATKKRA